MGQSSSNNGIVDPNNQTFTIHINQCKAQFPDYVDLKQEFRNKFNIIIWNQLLDAVDQAMILHRNNSGYASWKSAYHSISALKICAMVMCCVPFCISIATFFVCLLLLFVSIFLSAVGTDNSFYIWHGTYNMLPLTSKLVIIASFIITFIGIVILYFTQKSLKPLQKTYAQNMSKYISANFFILNKLYGMSIVFEMGSIKIKKRFFDCKCGEYGIELTVFIKIILFSDDAIEPLEDIVVTEAFNPNSESSVSFDETVCGLHGYGRIRNLSASYQSINGNRAACQYYPVQVEGIGEIETSISIEIDVEDLDTYI